MVVWPICPEGRRLLNPENGTIPWAKQLPGGRDIDLATSTLEG